MLTPSRVVLSVRPNATPALLVAAASVALHFAASPFLIPVISDRWDVALGSAGLISVAQVGGFTLSNFVAGRRLRPRRRWLLAAAAVGVAANLLSAVAPQFVLLISLRALAGAAAGLVTWLAWTEAMQDRDALKDVAAVGPLAALIGSPLVAWLVTIGDDRIVFAALAVSCIPAVFLRTTFGAAPSPKRRRMSPSRSNVILLVALGILTAAGSSLFIYAGAVGDQRLRLDPVLIALAFSANAGAGLVATRRRAQQAWPWLMVIAGCAITVAFATNPLAWFGAMTLWGYAFWMAVPVVLGQIAAWSLVPEERTGDAQGIMALGRVFGPAIGALLLGTGSFSALGVEAGLGLATSACLVGFVAWYRRRHPERRPVA